jgi:hypothetical protein
MGRHAPIAAAPPALTRIAGCGQVAAEEEPVPPHVERETMLATGWRKEVGARRVPPRQRILAAPTTGGGPNLVVVGGLLHPLWELHLRRLARSWRSGNGGGRGTGGEEAGSAAI